MPKNQAAKPSTLPLPVFRQCLEVNVVRDNGASQEGGPIEERIISKARRAILLSRQNVDLSKAELLSDGVVDMYIEVEGDGHGSSDKAFRFEFPPDWRRRLSLGFEFESIQFFTDFRVDFLSMVKIVRQG